MAIYAIGDVQGCFQELTALLEKIQFNFNEDTLWFAGDLVNRGPHSLEVLRFVKQLGDKAVTVLGNHDLHLLAIAHGHSKLRKDDTLKPILNAKDRDQLLSWLRHRPLMHFDKKLNIGLIHAGLPPQWTVKQAQGYSLEVEEALSRKNYKSFFANMYGNQPDLWSNSLSGWDRLRFITNCFTRLRYLDGKGRLCLKAKGPVDSQSNGHIPWFQHSERRSKGKKRLVFGHWSTLGFYDQEGVVAIDTGCVWGGKLTAVRLDLGVEELPVIQLECKGARKPEP